MLESVIVEMRSGTFQEHRVGVLVRKCIPLKCLFSVQLIEGGTSEHDSHESVAYHIHWFSQWATWLQECWSVLVIVMIINTRLLRVTDDTNFRAST